MDENIISLELRMKMYKEMLRIRKIEERFIELYNSGEVRSLMHLSIGQEAVAVGVCNALRKQDSLVSTHRDHAHYLAKGGDLKKLIAELAGKADGCSSGKGGSMLLCDLGAGMTLSSALVGGSVPIAVGIALSAKMKGEDRVSVAFFGDGTVEEGVFWESLNYACVHKLPVIFVCENNLYATHSHILTRQPKDNIAERMVHFGLESSVVDGNDVEEVFENASDLVSAARKGFGPSFLETRTYRWKEHWGPGDDWHLGYRSREEIEAWKKRCPIKLIREKLAGFDVNEDYFIQLEQEIEKEIDEAVEFAKRSPEPLKEKLLEW